MRWYPVVFYTAMVVWCFAGVAAVFWTLQWTVQYVAKHGLPF
jgi:hypothetical protein